MRLFNPLKLLSGRKKHSIWKDESGRYKTVVYSGKKASRGLTVSPRSTSTLNSYWKYYNGEGIVFASINTTAWNTVMVGYHLSSKNEEAKKLIQDYLDRLNFQSILLDNVVFTLVYGDAFIEIVRTSSGKITDLKTVDPKTIVINTDEYGNVESYQQVINGKVRDVVLKPEDIIHIKFFPNPSSPYGISLIEPSKDTIDRKIDTDEAIFNAIQRHTAKYVVTVGTEEDIPPREVMEDIEKKFEDIDSSNEFVVPGVVRIDTIDEKGVQGVEEYFNIFLTQSVIGLLCPEEALGLGAGSTEACNDEKTEVLTDSGWKHYWELTNDDKIATFNPETEMIEYHKPLDPVDTYVYDHDGPMIRIKSTKADMLVTPNHRMFVNSNPTSTNENWHIIEARDLLETGSKWAFKSKVKIPAEENFDDSEISFMKFLGYFISEGSINRDSPYCRLSQKKNDSAARIREVLGDIKYKFKESFTENKGYEWHIYSHELWNFLRQFGRNCYDRKIPIEIKNKSPSLLKYLLFAALDGDGTKNKNYGWQYATTSQQLADDIQEIAIKCGYRAQLSYSDDKRGNRKRLYRVFISKNSKGYISIESRNVSEIHYKGKVYSLNVPNHIYITRRNGKISIHGNTSKVKEILYERMIRAFQMKLSIQIKNELVNPILEEHGFQTGIVDIKFNSVTDADEAVKAKWLGNLLRGFREGEKKPFTNDEIRAMFGYPPLNENSTS